MTTAHLSSKGQIILPKSIRDSHHWAPGTEFEVETLPEGILLRPKKRFATTKMSDVIGCTGYQGPARSLEEMVTAIARGVSERRDRGRY